MTGAGLAMTQAGFCSKLRAGRGVVPPGLRERDSHASRFNQQLPTAAGPFDFPRPNPSIESVNILVADDVAEIRTLIVRSLAPRGHTVVTAADGAEAILHLSGGAIDLVIADILMPVNDGLDLIKESRRVQPNARILVISGGGHFLQAGDCIKLAMGFGADAALLKPFDEPQLMNAIAAATAPRRPAPGLFIAPLRDIGG